MDAAYSAEFQAIINIVLTFEGGLSVARDDPGNWTGGVVGRGRLLGTNFGLSAASFPTLDIAAITREQATSIYYALYWQRTPCDSVPAPLALLIMDAAVNNGVGRAVRWLQAAAGTSPDGLYGTTSMTAVRAMLATPSGLDSLRAEFQAQRLMFMAALPNWRAFGLGWARRLMRLPFLSLQLTPA